MARPTAPLKRGGVQGTAPQPTRTGSAGSSIRRPPTPRPTAGRTAPARTTGRPTQPRQAPLQQRPTAGASRRRTAGPPVRARGSISNQPARPPRQAGPDRPIPGFRRGRNATPGIRRGPAEHPAQRREAMRNRSNEFDKGFQQKQKQFVDKGFQANRKSTPEARQKAFRSGLDSQKKAFDRNRREQLSTKQTPHRTKTDQAAFEKASSQFNKASTAAQKKLSQKKLTPTKRKATTTQRKAAPKKAPTQRRVAGKTATPVKRGRNLTPTQKRGPVKKAPTQRKTAPKKAPIQRRKAVTPAQRRKSANTAKGNRASVALNQRMARQSRKRPTRPSATRKRPSRSARATAFRRRMG